MVVAKEVLEEILKRSLLHMDSMKRKTLHELDVFRAGQQLGNVVYSMKMFSVTK
jgi:histone H3/H4